MSQRTLHHVPRSDRSEVGDTRSVCSFNLVGILLPRRTLIPQQLQYPELRPIIPHLTEPQSMTADQVHVWAGRSQAFDFADGILF